MPIPHTQDTDAPTHIYLAVYCFTLPALKRQLSEIPAVVGSNPKDTMWLADDG